MINVLIWLRGCCADEKSEGMVDCRVSSDDRVYQWLLADFSGKARLASAWVSTHYREVLRGQCTLMVVNESELCVCPLTACEGSYTVTIFLCNIIQ